MILRSKYDWERHPRHFCDRWCRGFARRRWEESDFWSRALPAENGCLIWQGRRSKDGYGVLRWRGEMDLAHRVAFKLAHGPIPEGLHILHRCDTPPCILPSDIFAGTPAENTQDAVAKGRMWYQRPKEIVT